ncbi:Uma2 family endonuclease [Phormidesmis sp. 146-35]
MTQTNVPIIAESEELTINICKFLVYHLQQYSNAKGLGLFIVSKAGIKTERNDRIPGIVVFGQTLGEQLLNRLGSDVLDFNEVPVLVIEVASDNWREDYIRKRAEYALIDIPEYCIVDPQKERVRIMTNPANEDGYQHTDFMRGRQIQFSQFPDLVLSVDEVLSPANVETLIKAEQAQRQQLEQELIIERQRAEQERQRAEKLAEMLRSQGINPNDL